VTSGNDVRCAIPERACQSTGFDAGDDDPDADLTRAGFGPVPVDEPQQVGVAVVAVVSSPGTA
jgi:hypothetical protein